MPSGFTFADSNNGGPGGEEDVPVPGMILLFGLGAAGLGLTLRRRNRFTL